MTPEVQNIFFPTLGGLLFILLSIIAWFATSMAKRWEESHKHHYANNNELRQELTKHVTDHHGRIKNVEKELQRHDGLFDDLEEKIEEIKK